MNKKLKNIFLTENKFPKIIWVKLNNQKHLMSKVGKFKFIPSGINANNGTCHHVTLVYNPTEIEYFFVKNIVENNEQIEIKIDQKCSDKNIEALTCRLFKMDGYEITIPNKILHITVSSRPGVPAKQSNDMLLNPENSENFNYTTYGKIEEIY